MAKSIIGSDQFSKGQQDAIKRYIEACWKHASDEAGQFSRKTRFETIDKYVHRTEEVDADRRISSQLRKAGDMNNVERIRVPIAQTHVETAHDYLREVFLSGYPMFGIVADKTSIDAALQLETLIAEHQRYGNWDHQFSMVFRDGPKYNESAVVVEWCKEFTPVFNADPRALNGATPKREVWEGNKVTRINPYNMFYDIRVPFVDLPKYGEYFGYTELWPLIRLYTFNQDQKELGRRVYNEEAAYNSSNSSRSFGELFEPQVNKDVAARSSNEMDWMSFMGLGVASVARDAGQYRDQYEVTTFFCRIVPKLWGFTNMSDADKPQIWKFVFVNGAYLISAEQLKDAHGNLPIAVCRPADPNLDKQATSVAEAAQPFQNCASALMDVGLAAARRHVNDRVAYDPSRFSEAEMNNPNPSGKIKARPAAFGTNIAQGLHHFPFQGDANAYLSQSQTVMQYANQAAGQNMAQQGQFVKGNKTRREFEDIMSNSNGRNREYALCYEQQMMSQVKILLISNILQYQGAVTLFNQEKQQQVAINPATLREAVLEFKVSDGYRSSEKLMDGDAWSDALTFISTTPQVQSQFNMGEMVSYLFKMRGANVDQFKKSPEELQYEQAVQSWQQTVVEIAKGGGANFPPQPTPQQFGINVGQQAAPKTIEGGPTGEQY